MFKVGDIVVIADDNKIVGWRKITHILDFNAVNSIDLEDGERFYKVSEILYRYPTKNELKLLEDLILRTI